MHKHHAYPPTMLTSFCLFTACISSTFLHFNPPIPTSHFLIITEYPVFLLDLLSVQRDYIIQYCTCNHGTCEEHLRAERPAVPGWIVRVLDSIQAGE